MRLASKTPDDITSMLATAFSKELLAAAQDFLGAVQVCVCTSGHCFAHLTTVVPMNSSKICIQGLVCFPRCKSSTIDSYNWSDLTRSQLAFGKNGIRGLNAQIDKEMGWMDL